MMKQIVTFHNFVNVPKNGSGTGKQQNNYTKRCLKHVQRTLVKVRKATAVFITLQQQAMSVNL